MRRTSHGERECVSVEAMAHVRVHAGANSDAQRTARRHRSRRRHTTLGSRRDESPDGIFLYK
eukprot:6209263-Pleurochrysis_carterae.AAC.6